jgi:microcystin-dependent protein
MSDPFTGEIRIFGFGFAPQGWAFCQGQLLAISQNTALFSLLGTQFGGDGKATYGLPNFAGYAACGQGQGPGLTPRIVGEAFGSDNVSLVAGEMPAHNHTVNIYAQSDVTKRQGIPSANAAIVVPTTTAPFTGTTTTDTPMAFQTIGASGGSQPHPNQQPYLALNFCIALGGVFPSRP